ncbi:hypothetical protein DIZ27_22795 [Streptomyces sp. NWU339]|uniref:hypothetical protein n=1 Tax=Streptomyces sp. NWU339 TaxID=2185284 RepID=UPI000D67FFDF|nr:hypothetical protein [Streptomyces sp. NWU339]PWI08278.1 hypothetical protein DIZ27_22795 [Streptomyces sp. NWU339]
MHDLIRRVARWLGLLFGPGTGSHRAGDRCPAGPAYSVPRTADSGRLPLHRSPYCLHLPLDGAASRLVRPYLTAHEQEQEQARRRHRRRVLVLAAGFGADLDQHTSGVRKAAA